MAGHLASALQDRRYDERGTVKNVHTPMADALRLDLSQRRQEEILRSPWKQSTRLIEGW
jgi:hypothetical protein